MTAVSALAYALLVLLAAGVHRNLILKGAGGMGRPGVREAGSGMAALAAFFFVPPGSLPPFCDIAWGGGIFILLFACSLALTARRGQGLLLLSMILAAVACAGNAYYRGIPGSWANLGTFVAMPVWSVTSVGGMAGFTLLATGLALAGGIFIAAPGKEITLVTNMQNMVAAVFFVTLFFSFTLSSHVRWPDALVAWCDFILFWVKIFCVCILAQRIRMRQHLERWGFAACMAGAVTVFFTLPPQ